MSTFIICQKIYKGTLGVPPVVEIDVTETVGNRRGNLILFYKKLGFDPAGKATPAYWEAFGVVAHEYLGKIMVQRMSRSVVLRNS